MTEELFFELIQVAIGAREGLNKTPSAKEWAKLYKMVEKQSLLGVCFAGIQKILSNFPLKGEDPSVIGMPEMIYLTWMGMAAVIQQKNEVVNKQCVELQEKLKADGLRSCILKGQGVAQMYGEQLCMLRQSGDIDVWIDASDLEVIDYVMKKAPTKEFDQKHIHFHCFDDTEVEAHWVPVKWGSPWNNKRLCEFFDSERESQFNNYVDGVCFPTASFQLVHQLLHVFRHYVYEGVGLRQMMDLFFALRAANENQNKNFLKIIELFKKLGLMRFVAATQWVLGEVFLMPKERMLCEPDAKEGQRLLNEIMIGGNFGHHDARNHVKGETFTQRFFRRWGRRFRMFRFDPVGTILMPVFRFKLEIWMRRIRRKYNV